MLQGARETALRVRRARGRAMKLVSRMVSGRALVALLGLFLAAGSAEARLPRAV